MQAHGYRIVPINPNATEVLGERCYPNLTTAAALKLPKMSEPNAGFPVPRAWSVTESPVSEVLVELSVS